jgi:hypothetical protein
MKPWPRRKPKEDKRLVGISFVDVLFALVIARVLEPFSNFSQLAAVGVAQLVLAGVLTLVSWIGYHNSWNRPRYFIRFPNLPLVQFVIDVWLVVMYWLSAVYAEDSVPGVCEGRVPGVCRQASALPEASFVTICFLLYMAWDWVGLLIRKDPQYELRTQDKDVPGRRKVTGWCFFFCFLILAYAFLASPSSTMQVIVLDGLLLAVVVGFRFWKEYVTPVGAYDKDEA